MRRTLLLLAPLVLATPHPAAAQELGFLTGWLGSGLTARVATPAARPRGSQKTPHSSATFTGAILATYYGAEMGRHARTANGESFNPGGLTCAHRSLPFGTRLQVTNPRNGARVTVRVNDRGPYRAGYSLDLAAGAARLIGFSSGPLHIAVIH